MEIYSTNKPRNQALIAMSELDLAKEQIAYQKLWLGVVVVIDLSLAGWVLTHTGIASWVKISAAVVGVVMITYAGLQLHRQIERRIDALRDL